MSETLFLKRRLSPFVVFNCSWSKKKSTTFYIKERTVFFYLKEDKKSCGFFEGKKKHPFFIVRGKFLRLREVLCQFFDPNFFRYDKFDLKSMGFFLASFWVKKKTI